MVFGLDSLSLNGERFRIGLIRLAGEVYDYYLRLECRTTSFPNLGPH